ncbi:MAG TPA: hypothetical protein VJV05_04620 [Pyrinomonadaceae bacterium]|nr:hypothetical protein [Pyrinomonadaceae bacterium]
MKAKFFCAVISLLVLSGLTTAQSGVEPTPTPLKVVITDSMPPARNVPSQSLVEPTPTPVKVVITNSAPANSATVAPRVTPTATPLTTRERFSGPAINSEMAGVPSMGTSIAATSLSFGQIKGKIAEAKRLLQTRPLATALVEGTAPTDYVRVAYQDSKSNRIDFFVLNKDSFLDIKNEKFVSSENGRQLRVRTIRGNGVNTPIVVLDDQNQQQLPLMVQYPVVRNGKYMETAYYMSTHPGLITSEVVHAGRYYVHNVIEIARDRLRDKGINISPKLADIAERLATVEHVDHSRFRNEYHANIYNDIFTLYALNEGQTYRYSVSSAGAGGMVQMIPSTYRMVRSWHPNIPLIPDFVEGMRNHVNATEAMLLYMQRTWTDLIASPTVAQAHASGKATQEQLMAAGYNSNPARIAGYINRAGENWTGLIPRETKIYLQIYESLEKHVPMTPRTK